MLILSIRLVAFFCSGVGCPGVSWPGVRGLPSGDTVGMVTGLPGEDALSSGMEQIPRSGVTVMILTDCGGVIAFPAARTS